MLTHPSLTLSSAHASTHHYTTSTPLHTPPHTTTPAPHPTTTPPHASTPHYTTSTHTLLLSPPGEIRFLLNWPKLRPQMDRLHRSGEKRRPQSAKLSILLLSSLQYLSLPPSFFTPPYCVCVCVCVHVHVGVVGCGGVWRCCSGVWRWCSGVWRWCSGVWRRVEVL